MFWGNFFVCYINGVSLNNSFGIFVLNCLPIGYIVWFYIVWFFFIQERIILYKICTNSEREQQEELSTFRNQICSEG